MATDPFQHFDEQRRSYELLDEHRAALVAEARGLLADEPDAEIVGLIVDGDAAEAVAIREAITTATGRPLGELGFRGLAPRAFVVEILRGTAPATLEWLPSSRTEDRRMLPLVVITKGGVRFGAVVCE